MPLVKTPELNMHYETSGTGREVLLLLHGNFASWRWWLPILKNAPRRYRIYAPDMRGCGDSDHPQEGYTIDQHAEDLNQFIQSMNMGRLHLVGHSLGGCVALEYALKHTKRIKTLTLVAPAPAEGRSVINASSYGCTFVRSASAMHRAFRLSEHYGTTRRTMQRALSRMMCQDQVGEDFEILVDDAVRMSHDAAVGHIHSLNDWDVQDALGGLQLPVLIIGGQKDSLISPENLLKATQKLPNGRLIIWPGMGHAPQLEEPLRFIRILNAFTKQGRTITVLGLRYNIRRFFMGMTHSHCGGYQLMYD